MLESLEISHGMRSASQSAWTHRKRQEAIHDSTSSESKFGPRCPTHDGSIRKMPRTNRAADASRDEHGAFVEARSCRYRGSAHVCARVERAAAHHCEQGYSGVAGSLERRGRIRRAVEGRIRG